MELLLNEQQALLRDSAARLFREFAGPKRARSLRDANIEIDPEAWGEVVRAGWLSALVPERAGGLGLGMVDIALMLEESGRQLALMPLAPAATGAWALSQWRGGHAALAEVLGGASLVVPAMRGEAYQAAEKQPVATRNADGFRLSGSLSFAPFARSADAFLVVAAGPTGDMLCLLRRGAPGVGIRTIARVDGSTAGELSLRDVPVGAMDALADSREAGILIAGMGERLMLCASTELLGLSEAALAMTVEYLKLREQFGRPIGSFQALQHRVVNAYVDVELTRSLLYRVAADLDRGQHHPAMVPAVKAKASRTALEITRTALQLHGAIGYTDEHDIGLYYKRAIGLAAMYGGDVNQISRFSALTGP